MCLTFFVICFLVCTHLFWGRVLCCRKQGTEKRARTIHEIGCVQAGEDWMERNLILLASFAILLSFMEVPYYYVLHCFRSFCNCLQIFGNNNLIHNRCPCTIIFTDIGHLLCAKLAVRYFCANVQMALTHGCEWPQYGRRLNWFPESISCFHQNTYIQTHFESYWNKDDRWTMDPHNNQPTQNLVVKRERERFPNPFQLYEQSWHMPNFMSNATHIPHELCIL